MNKKYSIGLVVIIVLVGFFALRGGKKDSETGPIKIGFLAPLTGDAASLGTGAKAAAEIAIDEINTAGGVNGRKIELVSEDTKCNAKDATSATQKMINSDHVVAFDGGLCSPETIALAPIAKEKKIVSISSCSSAPSITGISPYVFRSYPSDAFQGKVAAEYMYNTMGVKKIAMLTAISDWGAGIKDVFAKRFTELGGTVVLNEAVPLDTHDLRTVIQKIKAEKPDAVYAALFPDAGIVLTKQMKDLSISLPILGADAWSDVKFQKEAVTPNGILYVSVKTPEQKDFIAKLTARLGTDATPICSLQSYDNVKIFAQVIAKVGTDGDAIAKELHSINYTGLSGPISFDEKGDLKVAEYVVKKVQNGVITDAK